jgi:hypothetical protein
VIIVRALVTTLLCGAVCGVALTYVKPATATESAEFTGRFCVDLPEMPALRGALSSTTARTLAAEDTRAGVGTDLSQVDVIVSRYGPYVTVSLVDNYTHKDSSGRAVLGCAGAEDYRVKASAAQVLPFDGCVESHTPFLPRFSQLPP